MTAGARIADFERSVLDRAVDAREGYPLAEGWPYLGFLGMGAWWAWIWLSYHSTELMGAFAEEIRVGNVYLMYVFSTLAIALAMVVIALNWKRITPIIDKQPVVVSFGALATVATFLLGSPITVGNPVLFAVFAFLTGIGTSFLCIKTGRMYGSVSLDESLMAGALSLVFAALLYFGGIGMPPFLHLAYIALLPLLAGALLALPRSDPFPALEVGSGERLTRDNPARKTFRRLVVAAALAAFTSAVSMGISTHTMDKSVFEGIGAYVTIGVAAIALILIVAINVIPARKAARVVYTALMILGMAIALASCFGMNISLLALGKEATWLVLSCLMAYVAFCYDFPPCAFSLMAKRRISRFRL